MSTVVDALVNSAQTASDHTRSVAKQADEEAKIWTVAAVLLTALVGLVAIVSISTSQRRLEASARSLASEVETRRSAEESALAASKAKSEFLAMMSHEVRTPLNGILGSAQLLASSPLSPQQRQDAQTIEGCGRSLLTVLDDILDYSKIEAKHMSTEKVPFELRPTVHRAVELQRANAAKKGLSLSLDVDTNELPGWVLGDPSRLSQVLNNLVGNAVKFTETGGVQVRVETRDSQIYFRVADSGIGIDKTALAALFQPFQQADSSIARRFGGTGLGLSISRRLVELMEGTIGVDSTPGEGSVFWFQLPLAMTDEPQLPGPADTAESGVPPRVLVVDDNLVNRRVAERMLQQWGAVVTVVDSGEAALEQVEQSAFDLVFMDVQMPGMDGLEATRRIRANPLHDGLTVIGLSANALAHHREAGLQSGMDAYLTKPFTIRDVAQCWPSPRAAKRP